MDISNIANKGISLLLAVLLSLFAFAFSPSAAYAVNDSEISDAKAKLASAQLSLDEAEARLASITSEFDAVNAEVDSIQAKIDDLAQQALEAQQAMLEGRQNLGNTAQYEYRNSTVSTVLAILFDSKDWSQLTKSIDYVNQIMDYQSDEIQRQKQRKKELDELSGQLSSQKDEQEDKMAELEGMRNQAMSVVNQASSELTANSDRLAALERQASELKRQENTANQPEIDSNANTVDRTEVNSPEKDEAEQAQSSSSQAAAAPAKPAVPNPSNSNSNSNSGGGWKTGRASAYGGSSDPYTPNPGRTATGAPCNDHSMGVAVPMSMPNYRSYFGRTVEIKYGGKTVYATVNDCGGMGNGYFKLDLQPGIFKAFGFNTCQAWGVRTVTYRFL